MFRKGWRVTVGLKPREGPLQCLWFSLPGLRLLHWGAMRSFISLISCQIHFISSTGHLGFGGKVVALVPHVPDFVARQVCGLPQLTWASAIPLWRREDNFFFSRLSYGSWDGDKFHQHVSVPSPPAPATKEHVAFVHSCVTLLSLPPNENSVSDSKFCRFFWCRIKWKNKERCD